MPLLSGKSNDVIHENIKSLKNEGKSDDQARAIAYKMAGRTKKKLKAVAAKATKPKGDKLQIKRTY